MCAKRSRRRRSRVEAVSPTSSHQTLRSLLLGGLVLCVAGMVFLYAGTKFWASAPFFLIGLLLIAWQQGLTFSGLLRDEGRLSPPAGTGLWVIVLFYILVRALVAPVVPYQAWTEFYQVGAVLLFYVAFSDLCNRGGAWRWVVASVLLMAVLQAMYAIWLHWHGSSMVLWLPRPEGYGMRASGSFICPNHYAHLLQMALILSVAVLATPGKNLPLKLFAGYSLLIGVPALGLSLSRSGVLGLAAGIVVVILCKAFRKGWRGMVLATLGTAGAGAVLVSILWSFVPPFRERTEQAMEGDPRWTQYWPDTWNLITAEGFWGVGPGAFRHVFEQYREHFASSRLYLDYPHNEYLHILAEYGWPMTLFLFIGIGVLLLRLFHRCLRIEEESRAMVPIAMLGVLCGTLVHAVFDFNLHITGNVLLLAMILGACDGVGLQMGVWRRRTPPRKFAMPLSLCSAGFAVLLALASIPLFWGGYHEYQMNKAQNRFRVEDARRHAAAIRKWTPIHWRGWTELGFEHRQAAGFMRNPSERERLIGLSRDAYHEAIARNPYERIALAGLAELSMLESDWDRSVELWTRLEVLAPFDHHVKVRKGQTLMRMSRVREALEVFEEAEGLRKDPATRRHIQHARRMLRERNDRRRK